MLAAWLLIRLRRAFECSRRVRSYGEIPSRDFIATCCG
jgi:hypothetical protein